MNNIGALVAVAIGCAIIGFVIGQNVTKLSLFGVDTYVVNNPLK